MTSTIIFIDHTANDLIVDRDTCVILGRSIDLNASGWANYDWVDNGTLVGCTTSSSSEVIPLIKTT